MKTEAQTLGHNTLALITERFDLSEVTDEDGGPLISLMASMGQDPVPVGSCRVWEGDAVRKMVYIGMTVPPINLDSHMIFAFTGPESAVPHFTLDAVYTQPPGTPAGYYAFHLDLIPRADPGANLAYIDAALTPLTDAVHASRAVVGFSPAHLSPRQYALMSPWMLAYRTDANSFAEVTGYVGQYFEHWAGMVENGLPEGSAPAATPNALAERDRHNRAAIFSPGVDPVWNNVARLVGEETSERLQTILKTQ